jgi:tetratricopeptide (TPR) repeat protein
VMFDATLSALAEASRRRPLLLLLEDLHWADATSLQLLGHLVRADLAEPLVVVVTRRTTEAAPPALVDTLADLARSGATRLHLEGLDAESVAAMLRETLGASHPALESVVAEVTGGNPLFVQQYARVLSGRTGLDELDPRALEVPEGVRDVLQQRIARLPDGARRTLAAASVLGHDISPEQVAALSGAPVETVLDDLDLALASGLVTEQTTGYAFVHALARDTVYLELSAARRMRMHDQAGRILEDALGTRPDAASAIARHAHIAATLSSSHAERAVTWQSRAAEVAAARHAHSEALDLWRSVLDDVPADSELAARAYGGIALAQMRLGRLVEATESLERGVELAQSRGAWDLVADLTGFLASAGPWSWRTHGSAHEGFIQTLTAALPHVSPESQARLHAVLQMEYFYGWRSDVGARHGDRALALARDLGDPDLLREVLMLRVVATTGAWDAENRLRWAREVLDLAPQGEHLVTALWFLGLVQWENRCPEAADEAIARCSALASELRHDGLDTPLAWWSAARARDRDDPAQTDLLNAAVSRLGAGSIATDELTCLAAVRALPRGDVSGEIVARARQGGPSLRAVVAHALLEAGDGAAAYELLGPAAPGEAVDYSTPAGRCLRLLVLAETGSPDEVREALALVEPHLGRVASYGSIDHCGVVDHFVASAYAALGDARARETAERALDLNRELGCLPWVRRSEQLLRRLG